MIRCENVLFAITVFVVFTLCAFGSLATEGLRKRAYGAVLSNKLREGAFAAYNGLFVLGTSVLLSTFSHVRQIIYGVLFQIVGLMLMLLLLVLMPLAEDACEKIKFGMPLIDEARKRAKNFGLPDEISSEIIRMQIQKVSNERMAEALKGALSTREKLPIYCFPVFYYAAMSFVIIGLGLVSFGLIVILQF